MKKCVIALAATIVAASVVAVASGAQTNSYAVHNLVSDIPGAAATTDPNLVNAWGLAASSTSPWWVADNGSDMTTVYDASGNPFPPASPIVVQVASAPSGAVANPGSNFVVGSGSASGPARFLFATEDGTILGWNPTASPTQALVAVPATDGAVYKGLTLANGDTLYATDFHNAKVDVFDGNFNPMTTSGAFVDPHMKAGFAPFGIQNIGGTIFVSYAKQDAAGHDDVAGQGLGFVDAYDTNGVFLGRVATRGQLNSPWGLAQAPADFGRFSGDLLVGNFGNGKINAYAPRRHGSHRHVGELKQERHGSHGHVRKLEQGRHGLFTHVGQLRGPGHKPIVIDGLWALQFGFGAANNGPTNTLFFTAGPNGESDGLFGSITAG